MRRACRCGGPRDPLAACAHPVPDAIRAPLICKKRIRSDAQRPKPDDGGMPCLGERMTLLRIVGIALALTGAVVMLYQADGRSAVLGLVSVAASAIALSAGSVGFKRLGAIRPLQLQAWVAVISALQLLLFSALTESGQLASSLSGGWFFAAAVLFSIFVVTIWAHTSLFACRSAMRWGGHAADPGDAVDDRGTRGLLMGDPMNLRIGTDIVVALIGVLLVQLSGTARGAGAPSDGSIRG